MSLEVYVHDADDSERYLMIGATFIDPNNPWPISTVYETFRLSSSITTKAKVFVGATAAVSKRWVYTDSITHLRPADRWSFIPQLCSDEDMQGNVVGSVSYTVAEVIGVTGISIGHMDLSPSRAPKREMTIIIAEKRELVGSREGTKVTGRVALCFFHNMQTDYFHVSGYDLLPPFVDYCVNPN